MPNLHIHFHDQMRLKNNMPNKLDFIQTFHTGKTVICIPITTGMGGMLYYTGNKDSTDNFG